MVHWRNARETSLSQIPSDYQKSKTRVSIGSEFPRWFEAACARNKPSQTTSDHIGHSRGHWASNFLIHLSASECNQPAPTASLNFQTSLQKSAVFSVSFHLDRWMAVLKVSPTLKTLRHFTVFSGSLILSSVLRLVVNIIDHLRTLLSSSGSRWSSAAFDRNRICDRCTHLSDF